MASAAALVAPRQLWDLGYVEGGCVGEPPPGSNTDDMFGTYASNYLILAVGLAAAAALLLSPKPAPFYKAYGACFFFWTALGYGIAGVLHQILHEDEDHMTHEQLWKLSYILTLFGVAYLGLLSNSLLVAKYPQIGSCEMCLNIALVAMVGGPMLMTLNKPELGLTGVVLGLTTLYALVVWALWGSCGKVFGSALCIAGFGVQALLSSTCGDAAYSDCFRECPLPAPYFNHNALFHVLYAIGLGIIGFLMVSDPEAVDDSQFSLLGA